MHIVCKDEKRRKLLQYTYVSSVCLRAKLLLLFFLCKTQFIRNTYSIIMNTHICNEHNSLSRRLEKRESKLGDNVVLI